MRFATFKEGNERFVGVVSSDGKTITTLNLPKELAAQGVLALIDIANQGKDVAALSGRTVSIDSVKLEAPIPRPRRNIFCVGRNYHDHAKELSGSVFKANDTNVTSWPIVFTKVPECVVGPYDNVILPGAAVSEQIDYEAELAIIIGTGGKNISKDQALKHIYGYTVVNDVTARDVQIRHQQWDLGKSFDTFCPMGPWVVTADEFDLDNTFVRCWVNEELRQEAQTSDLIFDIPTLIETCSRGITLYPGDIIATGTPAGVGMGMKPPQYLKAGDNVRIEISGLGGIQNRISA
jgi:2-keto-4-pentenoate hydratase/2-oxohepta-3-ene-1,7-dioic acid hydratase in catechol pathway